MKSRTFYRKVIFTNAYISTNINTATKKRGKKRKNLMLTHSW